jgi:hypothetical protein
MPLLLYYSFFSTPIIQQLSVHFVKSSSYIDGMCFSIHYHSLFLSILPLVPSNSLTITNMFYIYVYILSFLHFCIHLSFGFIFHIWEKSWTPKESTPNEKWANVNQFSKKKLQIANKYMKKCSTYLFIKEMQIKMTLRSGAYGSHL